MTFAEKYRPKSLSQVIGQQSPVIQLLSFIKKRTKDIAIVYGPVGIGKTSAVHSLASDFGYEIIELNASDLRNKARIDAVVKGAIEQKSLAGKDKIILIDEIDGISGSEDRGCMEELNRIINGNYPVVMITNNPFEKKLYSVRKRAEMIKFDKLSVEDIIKVISEISDKEKLNLSPQELKKIALLSEGDARAAVNDLYAFSGSIEALGERERENSIFNALKLIFKGNSFNATSNALTNVEMDIGEATMWIDENLPLEYHGKELRDAYYMLSRADIFRSRIIRRQHWRFLIYANLFLTAGVALSKKGKKDSFVQYKPVKRLLKIWIANRTEKKEIARKFSKIMHCSTKKVMKEMPYLEQICENNPEMLNELKEGTNR